MIFSPKLKLAMSNRFSYYMMGGKICPVGIEVSLCGNCNAACPECFYRGKHDHDLIDSAKLIRFLSEGEKAGLKSVTWTGGGESTLHPEFKEITRAVNLKQGLITNALKFPDFDPEIFEWIRVSKTDKPLPIENIKILRRCKKLGICINDTMDSDKIKGVIDDTKSIKPDYIQVRPALNLNGKKTIISIPKIKGVLITDYKYSECSTDRKYKKCVGFHFVPFLWHDGRLDVCGYMRGIDNYNIGNIYESSFHSLLALFPESVSVDKKCQMCCKNHEINDMVNNCNNLDDLDFV